MFLNYINNFRGIAILFILSGHCMDAFNWHNKALTYHILSFFIKNGTVLFMFIGGFLFQHLSHKYKIAAYLSSKAKNIILPYIIVSIPAIVYFTFITHRADLSDGFYNNPIAVQILSFYITGDHITAFWFIPMITLYYLISPLLIRLDKSRFFYYFIPLFTLISMFFPRSDNVLIKFILFFPVYVFGMFCSRYKIRVLEMSDKYFLWILLAYFIAFMFKISDFYFDWDSNYANLPRQLILCVLMITLLYKYENIIKDKGKYLASISFGLYFIHSYVIQMLRYLLSDKSGGLIPFNASIFVLILFCTVVIAISGSVIAIIQKIFGKSSRYIIGS